mmetsp:Transcript_22067/g.51455  ORF Transcript_22067/g.51455 Transcript_22067/m.51455 type:complete len:244 (+) Transcript_22067:2325-3056(+)
MSQIMLRVPMQSITKKKLKGYELSEKLSSKTSDRNRSMTPVSTISGAVLLVNSSATQTSGTYKASMSAVTITIIIVRLRRMTRTTPRTVLTQLFFSIRDLLPCLPLLRGVSPLRAAPMPLEDSSSKRIKDRLPPLPLNPREAASREDPPRLFSPWLPRDSSLGTLAGSSITTCPSEKLPTAVGSPVSSLLVPILSAASLARIIFKASFLVLLSVSLLLGGLNPGIRGGGRSLSEITSGNIFSQ